MSSSPCECPSKCREWCVLPRRREPSSDPTPQCAGALLLRSTTRWQTFKLGVLVLINAPVKYHHILHPSHFILRGTERLQSGDGGAGERTHRPLTNTKFARVTRKSRPLLKKKMGRRCTAGSKKFATWVTTCSDKKCPIRRQEHEDQAHRQDDDPSAPHRCSQKTDPATAGINLQSGLARRERGAPAPRRRRGAPRKIRGAPSRRGSIDAKSEIQRLDAWCSEQEKSEKDSV